MQKLLVSKLSGVALHFRDYIRIKYAVELLLEESEEGDILYLPLNSPHYAEILQERDQFLQHPFDSRYEQASWQVGEVKQIHKTTKNGSDLLPFIQQYLPAFTSLISLLCIAIYGLGFIIGEQPIFLALHYPAFADETWQVWRYISHSLVHLSLAHLLLNLTWWIYIGNVIERNLGWGRLCLLYLLFAGITGFAQNWVSGPAFFGLSGVVYGLIGYAFVLDKLNQQHWFKLPSGFGLMIIIGVLTGFVAPLIGVNVGNTAHIVGLIAGVIAGFIELAYHRVKTTVD